MEYKHTPGPWRRSSYGFQVLGNNNHVSVCHLDGKQGEEIQMANAQLIAAAPEMLKSLIELRNYFGEHDKSITEHKMFAIADVVIKKATQ